MSKFNGTKKTKPTGKNMAGGVSYDRTVQKEIASVVLNSMLKGNDSYYETEAARLQRIEKLITKNVAVDGEFIAKAMVYTRNDGNLRSISHFIAGLLAENVKGESFLKPAFVKAIVRPDDMTEMLSVWNGRNKGKMVPNALRRAFKVALESKFDEYQFRKYAQPNSVIKLKDVVKMAHPSPKKFEDKTIFKRVIEDQLKVIETAQTINASKSGKERVDAYMGQIKAGKMGYMAAVKNIRTMLENNISESDLKIWANMITDPGKVARSRMLPFRFMDAWRSVKNLTDSSKNDNSAGMHNTALRDQLENAFADAQKRADIPMNKKLNIVKGALERAFALSAGNTNIAGEGEKVAILLDESGSMGGMHYGNQEENKDDPFYVGKVLSASMQMGMDKDACRFYTWADHCTERNVKGQSPFDFIGNLNTRGGGTDVSAPMRELIKNKTFVDKIVIFTDMQLYHGWGNIGDQVKKYLNEYRRTVNSNVKLLFWNLQGYGGGSPLDLEKTPGVFEVSGYSDKLLKIVPRMWDDKDFLIKEIESITL